MVKTKSTFVADAHGVVVVLFFKIYSKVCITYDFLVIDNQSLDMHDIASNLQSLTFGGSTKAWSGRHRRSETIHIYIYKCMICIYMKQILYICRNRYVMLIYYILHTLYL